MEKSRKIKALRTLAAAALALALCLSTVWALPKSLVPLGEAVGVELRAPGAIVAGFAADGSPALASGVRAGDLITALDGQPVGSAEDFPAALERAGASVTLTIVREGRTLCLDVTPIDNDEGRRLGLWLRSGMSGIGTVTFVDPATGFFGALGHPVSDADTGSPLPLGEGFVTPAEITAVRRGEAGEPGELGGSFDPASPRGTVLCNTACGLFGYLDGAPGGEPVPVAAEREIVPGAATIRCTVEGSDPAEYAVRIDQVRRGETRTLSFTVTDPRLLAKTGGVVQGMSGSPILQNGKLVGAVTHVTVADPTRGFGVSLERMYAEWEKTETAA